MDGGHMPAIFFGHGNPMNALRTNEWTRGWGAFGREIPKPKAVLSVSAHWYVPETAVTAMEAPRTIHDFGGFPPELYGIRYPAPGSPPLAARVRELLHPLSVRFDDRGWGLDHGSWSVLRHVFPDADVPVVQLSVDERRPPRFHYDLGRRLAPLRREGILVVGSGNLVHNLHAYAWGERPVPPFDWAVRFENRVRELLRAGEDDPVVEYVTLGPDGARSVPTPDHYLPLLYVLGLRGEGDHVSFPVEGVDGGSVSMLAVRIG